MPTTLGAAELEARLAQAEREAARLAAAGPTALGPATDALNRAANAWSVGTWQRRLGRAAEGRAAIEAAEDLYLRWLDLLASDVRARASFGSAKWLSSYCQAVVHGWRRMEQRLVAMDADPRDNTLVPVARPFAAVVLALAREDAGGLAEARAALRAIPDEKATKDKWYPGLPAVFDALVAGDEAALGPALGAIAGRYGELLARGHFSDADVEHREPAFLLALARRRGLRPAITDEHRRVRLRQRVRHVTEWEGRAIGPEEFHVEIDLVDPDAAWIVVEKSGNRSARTGPRSKVRSELPEEVVRTSLAEREAGPGPAWYKASWALMLGDPERARRHLATELEAARRRPDAERLPNGARNPNLVFEHLSLALAAGSSAEIDGAIASLRRLADETPLVFSPGRYAMANGYLTLIADTLAGRPPGREPALGLFAHQRQAAVGLVERDGAALSAGLDDILREHVTRIDRKSPAGPPLCVEAIHVAVAAGRLGVAWQVDPGYRAFPVPILVTNPPEHRGKVGHLACDLLGEAVWAGAG